MTPTEIGRVTIIKTFDTDADGAEAIVTQYSDGLSLVDALGMIAFAQATTFGTYVEDEGDDDGA